jgi:hypothetical protein
LSRAEALAADALRVLELVGVAIALLLAVGIVLGIIRSIWRVTFGRATLVLPFAGADPAPAINEILAQQLDDVERACQKLSRQIAKEEGAIRGEAQLVDLGPRGRALSDSALDERADKFVLEQPIAGEAIGPITFAGVTVSPETIFALFYRLRSVVARRAVRRSLVQLGETAHLSAIFTYGRAELEAQGHGRRGRKTKLVVLVRDLERPRQLLDLADPVVVSTWIPFPMTASGIECPLSRVRVIS